MTSVLLETERCPVLVSQVFFFLVILLRKRHIHITMKKDPKLYHFYRRLYANNSSNKLLLPNSYLILCKTLLMEEIC